MADLVVLDAIRLVKLSERFDFADKSEARVERSGVPEGLDRIGEGCRIGGRDAVDGGILC